jgi:hypothetical protein
MKNTNHLDTPYSLADFYLAAFLISSGMDLLRTDRTGTNRVNFVLRDSPLRNQLIQDFYARKAKVDPLQYKDAIVNLKSLIHGLRGGQ